MITNELKSHFLRLYQMAFVDDDFDVLELQMLYKFAEERGISKEQLNEILLNPSHDSSIPETKEEKISYLYDLAIMIWVDKKVAEDEYITLKKYCKKFGFLEENINEIADYLLECAQKNVKKEVLINEINS
ncbi:hypothetical protein [Kordia sp.]|uniref:hypothetical protein n=1 Tax=Kordia sp. TaxID=1965332 RepID=UPI003D69FEEC